MILININHENKLGTISVTEDTRNQCIIGLDNVFPGSFLPCELNSWFGITLKVSRFLVEKCRNCFRTAKNVKISHKIYFVYLNSDR